MDKSIYSEQSKALRSILIELRETAKLTQRALAERIGREHSFVARIELGERRVDVAEFYGLVKACEAQPGAVFQKVATEFARLDGE